MHLHQDCRHHAAVFSPATSIISQDNPPRLLSAHPSSGSSWLRIWHVCCVAPRSRLHDQVHSSTFGTAFLTCDIGGAEHDSRSQTMGPMVEHGFALCVLERNDQPSRVEHGHTRRTAGQLSTTMAVNGQGCSP